MSFPGAVVSPMEESCQLSRKACWEAGEHERFIDLPVASNCLFINNQSMHFLAGGCRAWPLHCSEHSHIHLYTQTYGFQMLFSSFISLCALGDLNQFLFNISQYVVMASR